MHRFIKLTCLYTILGANACFFAVSLVVCMVVPLPGASPFPWDPQIPARNYGYFFVDLQTVCFYFGSHSLRLPVPIGGSWLMLGLVILALLSLLTVGTMIRFILRLHRTVA